MNTDTKYNGWTNWETWLVALHLGNEQGSQSYWSEQAQEALDCNTYDMTGVFNQREHAIIALAESMKSQLDDDKEELGLPVLTGFYADLLNGALGEVNWHEIAKHYINDVIEEAEYQSKKGAK